MYNSLTEKVRDISDNSSGNTKIGKSYSTAKNETKSVLIHDLISTVDT